MQKTVAQNGDTWYVKRCLHALNEVLIHDITSPPVASRNYVYPFVAFYEAVRPGSPGFKTYGGRLNGLSPLPEMEAGAAYDWLVAGTSAFYRTNEGLVFSKDLFQELWDSIDIDIRKRPVPKDVYERSVRFGEAIASHILKWAREDNLSKIRTMPRFTPAKKPGAWQQTSPDYMEAVEPYWNKIRPMVLDKAEQFLLPPPFPFGSEKFKEAQKEVYEISKNLTAEQKAQAQFWDCNPFATETVGHLMYSVKKISPAGHWMGITNIAITQQKQGLAEALQALSLVSIGVFDVIIAAWDEKYRSNYIRPITAIQQSTAPEWQPVLQTPPFPEYISGHSVISMTSAIILTRLYGDHFQYVDNVERDFGLPDRSFNSFTDAANEAAMSRLYGGIHFRQAIENGLELGKNVGNYVIGKLMPEESAR